jgi:SAM-dependent methyltransferase
MASDAADHIIDLYQRKASDWIESRARSRLFEQAWLDRFHALIPPAGSVLDLGCGSAEPMAGYLIGLDHPVTGVDSSPAMIALPAAGMDHCRYAPACVGTAIWRHPCLG